MRRMATWTLAFPSFVSQGTRTPQERDASPWRLGAVSSAARLRPRATARARAATRGRNGDAPATRTPGGLTGREPLLAAMFAVCMLFAHALSATVPLSREWAATWNLGSFNDRGQSIATDSTGNVYVAGFDQQAYYLSKYSPTGTQLWSKTAVTTGSLFLQGFINAFVVVDPSDNPILAGTMDANDGTSLDYVVVKFDAAGTQLWLRRFDDAAHDHDSLTAVAVDEVGNIYAHGHGNGSTARNVYTVKYDRDGTQLWVATYTDADDLGCDVAVHADGSVYALVSTTGYTTDDDIILIKYNASGEQLWLRRYNGCGESGWTDDWPSRLKLDSAGNAYLVGYSEISDGGGYGVVTQKYLADGTLAWTRRYDVGPPSSSDFGYQPAGLAIDDSGQVYVSGQIPNHSTGSMGVDIVTIKYAADGTQLWASAYNGSANGADKPRDLVLAPDGSIFVLASSCIDTFWNDYRLLLIRYDTAGTLLSADTDSGSDDGSMLARRGASIYTVGTSSDYSYDVTIRKYSPTRSGCSTGFSPSARLVGAPASSGYTVSVAAPAGCSWTASSSASWIAVDPAGGSGEGQVSYSVAANSTAAVREGFVVVDGWWHLVTQTAPLDAPAAVTATATSTTDIGVSWLPVSPAFFYEVRRSSNHGPFLLIATPAGTTLTDSGRSPGVTYLYVVRAISGAGMPSSDSAPDPATTIAFTDDPLTAGTTVKRGHLTELRAAVNAFRASAGLDAYPFTDPEVTTTTLVRAIHTRQLRAALDAGRAALGMTPLAYTDPTITSGATIIRAAHLQEIRAAVK